MPATSTARLLPWVSGALMKIGMITDSLPGTDFDTLVDTSARLGLDMLEFACGNWSPAPHIRLDRMLESESARREFRARLDAHGIAISALNCSGNPLHPGEAGRRHDAVTRKTIKLASLMGVDRVVLMSGCPGAPGDAHANWITTEWPPEVREILRNVVSREDASVGGLGTEIAALFAKTGLTSDIPELRGEKVKPAIFGP